MARADWTYEVPPAGSDSAGLEEYVVDDSAGETVGKVQTLLRRGDETYVAVERGTPPATHDVRVVRWEDVSDVDDASLRVRLAVPASALDDALELDPDRAVEGGEADARRVTDIPGRAKPAPRPTSSGPLDTDAYLAAVWLGGLGCFATLVVVIFATRFRFTWEYLLFAVPALLLLLAGLAGYGTFRRPYERR